MTAGSWSFVIDSPEHLDAVEPVVRDPVSDFVFAHDMAATHETTPVGELGNAVEGRWLCEIDRSGPNTMLVGPRGPPVEVAAAEHLAEPQRVESGAQPRVAVGIAPFPEVDGEL